MVTTIWCMFDSATSNEGKFATTNVLNASMTLILLNFVLLPSLFEEEGPGEKLRRSD